MNLGRTIIKEIPSASSPRAGKALKQSEEWREVADIAANFEDAKKCKHYGRMPFKPLPSCAKYQGTPTQLS
jgi:hypothetical protein